MVLYMLTSVMICTPTSAHTPCHKAIRVKDSSIRNLGIRIHYNKLDTTGSTHRSEMPDATQYMDRESVIPRFYGKTYAKP